MMSELQIGEIIIVYLANIWYPVISVKHGTLICQRILLQSHLQHSRLRVN